MSWLFCHPERSEGSRRHWRKVLRFAQDDRIVGLTTSLLLAFLFVAPVAQAQELAGHSVTYDVKQLKEDKAVYLEGQASSTISRSCKEWSLGEIFQLAIERARPSGKAI